jgi:hypothetical protein
MAWAIDYYSTESLLGRKNNVLRIHILSGPLAVNVLVSYSAPEDTSATRQVTTDCVRTLEHFLTLMTM